MLDEIMEKIAEAYPSQDIRGAYRNLGGEEKGALQTFLDCVGEVYRMDAGDVIDSYKLLVDDTLEESMYFLEHGRYRYATFREVDEYMNAKKAHYMRAYQVGIFLSLFLWPNHSEMRKRFIDTLSERKGGAYLEVGVGHGYYFSEAVAGGAYDSYLGIDINEDSLHMAASFLKHRPECRGGNYELRLLNLFDMQSDVKFDAIVSGEVLEHVEDPGRFLRKFAEMADEKTFIYLTTAINAPCIDHIYLFRKPEELRDLFRESGLQIVDMQFLLYQGKPLETCLRKKMPLSVVITARRA